MEPAAGGRDDEKLGYKTRLIALPQWSPPLVGGTTDGIRWRPAVLVEPQWSPPLVGGTTTPAVTPSGIDAQPPQWSPPLVGGTTYSSVC